MIPLCSCGGSHTHEDCPVVQEEIKGTLRFLSESFRAQAIWEWHHENRAASKVYDLCAADLEKRWMP